MVLRKIRTSDDILFVDASKGFMKDGNKNKLRQRDIRKIVDTVIARRSIDNYSRLVSYDEIEKNGFNLNIARYVDSSIKEIPHDIYALMFGGIPNSEINSGVLSKYWEQFPTLKEELFSPLNNDYSALRDLYNKTIIENNKQVCNYKNAYSDKFSYLKEYLDKELFDPPEDIHLTSLESKIAELLFKNIGSNFWLTTGSLLYLFYSSLNKVFCFLSTKKK